jgi:hypothetical protein
VLNPNSVMTVSSQRCTVHSLSVCRLLTQLTAAETRTWGDVSVSCVQLLRPGVMYLLHPLPPHINARQAGPHSQQRLQHQAHNSVLKEVPSNTGDAHCCLLCKFVCIVHSAHKCVSV